MPPKNPLMFGNKINMKYKWHKYDKKYIFEENIEKATIP